jgi:hypothetical protein
VFDFINRNNLYTRYYLLHNVPRFNNPTSTFDNDQYLLEVITDGIELAFEQFVEQWLAACNCQDVYLNNAELCLDACIPIYPYPGQVIPD